MEIELRVQNISEENRAQKFNTAVMRLSKAMKIPATIKEKKTRGREEYPYRAQEDLYQLAMERFGLAMDDLYSRLCSTLGMKPKNRFSKAIAPNAPKLGKEIIWNPSTGKPITQKELDGLLKNIDKFLNRNVADKKDEIVISEASVARIISNLRRGGQSFDELREIPLKDLKTPNGQPWHSIKNAQQLNSAFPADYVGLNFQGRILGNYITQLSDDIRGGIVNILDNGYAGRLPKGEISQQLFDKFGGYNKDWDRILDTEGVNVFNQQYIDEQRRDVAPGEPLYFIRREYFDNKTCQFCNQAQNPIIAKWVEKPLGDENIDDPVASIAIWPGKTNFGRQQADWQWAEGSNHPHCRGSWDRYYEEYGDFEL